MRLRHCFTTSVIIASLAVSMPAFATSMIADKGTVLEIPASVVVDMANDEANLSFYVTETGESLTKVTAAVIERVNTGLAQLKTLNLPVKYETYALSSWPRYSQPQKSEAPKIIGWEVRQSIRATVGDVGKAAQVAQAVGEHFAFESVQFGVSQHSHEAAQNELTLKAIEAVKAKSVIVAQALGASQEDVKIEKIEFSGGAMPRPMLMRNYGVDSANRMAKSAMPLPSFEAGSSALSVTVNAKIRVKD